MTLPVEKIAELRQIIQSHLSKNEVQDEVHSRLVDAMKNVTVEEDNNLVVSHLQSLLRDNGIIASVLEELQHQYKSQKSRPLIQFTESRQTTTTVPAAGPPSSRCHLFLQVVKGKAFLEFLANDDRLPGQQSSSFRLFLHFGNQRFVSKWTPCCCEPEFNEAFLLEIPNIGPSEDELSAADLLPVNCPLHIVLIRRDSQGRQMLIASHLLEWRSVLSCSSGHTLMSIELHGVGEANEVPVGILELNLELVPVLSSYLAVDAVATQLTFERTRRAEQERVFFVYAKQWWQEYLQIRSNHEQRYVKIFAQDENGSSHPVCQYVWPLKAGRLLDTPRDAAWFVALIPHEAVSRIGGSKDSKMERWAHIHTLLCLNKGVCEEHALLLCCLLLGFGLDAYVCIGSKDKGEPYAWVVTLGSDNSVTFWDPLTATRYPHAPIDPNDPPLVPQPKPSYPFTRIGCLFNHESFFANNQVSDSVYLCRFDLSSERHWKAMAADSLQMVCGPNARISVRPPPLMSNSLDPLFAATDLEQELQSLVVEYRLDRGLTTVWDEQLSYLMGIVLANYEVERRLGSTVSNEEFSQAIRRAVPNGHTFKGFPTRFSHCYSRRVFTASLRSSVCSEILGCRGDLVRHAIRVRVFVYPESVVSVWVMFAVKYKSII